MFCMLNDFALQTQNMTFPFLQFAAIPELQSHGNLKSYVLLLLALVKIGDLLVHHLFSLLRIHFLSACYFIIMLFMPLCDNFFITEGFDVMFEDRSVVILAPGNLESCAGVGLTTLVTSNNFNLSAIS